MMQITACPSCGSKRITVGNLSDGIIAGLSSWKEVCQDCGYQGAPLLFETEEEYKKFLNALQDQKTGGVTDQQAESIDAESAEMTTEDKEISAFLDETAECPPHSDKKNYKGEFILAVIFSIIFLIIFSSVTIQGINDIIFSDDFFTAILNFLGIFISGLIFFFLAIIFVETIYRSMKKAREKK